MKKIVFLLLLIATSLSVNAQSTSYCEIRGYKLSFDNLSISINFGTVTEEEQQQLHRENNLVILDKKGRERTRSFKTMIDALNHMCKQGWKLEQTYALIDKSDNEEHHWILSKTVDK